MSVDHKDFAQIANILAQGSSEIEWRVSASKAYYSAFHHAQKSADLCPSNSHLGGMGDHQRLSNRYELLNTKGAKSISYALNAMKKVRHIADYELNDAFQQSMAEKQLSDLRIFSQRIVSFEDQNRLKTVSTSSAPS